MGQFFWYFYADIQSAYRCICTCDYSHVGVCIIQKNPKKNLKLRFTSLSGWVWVKVCALTLFSVRGKGLEVFAEAFPW